MYDIYQQTNNEDVDDMLMERMYSVFAIDLCGENDDEDGSEEFFDCSDDSNDENNWRNDYPDEESTSSEASSDGYKEDHSINEEDMVRAMKNMDFYDLSSDDEEEKESASDYCDTTSDHSDLSLEEFDDPVGSDDF